MRFSGYMRCLLSGYLKADFGKFCIEAAPGFAGVLGEPVGPVGNATLVLIFPSRSEDQATAPDGCSTLSYFALITAGGDISRRRGGLRVVYI